MRISKHISAISLSIVSHLAYSAALPNGDIVNVYLHYDNNFLIQATLDSQGGSVSTQIVDWSGYPIITFSNTGEMSVNDPFVYSFSESLYNLNAWSINYDDNTTVIDQIYTYGNPFLELPHIDIYQDQFNNTLISPDSQFLDIKLSINGSFIPDFQINLSDGQNWLYIPSSLLDSETLRLDLSGISLTPDQQYTLDIYSDLTTDIYFEGYSEGNLVMTGTAMNKGTIYNSVSFATEPSNAIPEPSSYALLCGFSLVGIILSRRKRK